MFQRAIICSLALILAASFCLFRLCRVTFDDKILYKKLFSESVALRSHHALERHPAHQKRERVQKDIWIMGGDGRRHFRLTSQHSDLTLTQKKDKVEAVEKLEGIDCWVQDEIDRQASLQQIRTLSAQEGVYYFPSHRFLASSVHMAFFRTTGTELPSSLFPEKPFLSGVASEIVFTAASRSPTFTAYHLKAELDPERGVP